MATHNGVRLHSAIAQTAAKDKLEGRPEAILAERERNETGARGLPRTRRHQKNLTERKQKSTLPVVGEADASSVGGATPQR